MNKAVMIFFLLLISNTGFSQTEDSLRVPSLFLEKLKIDIINKWNETNEWFCINESNNLWHYKNKHIHFNIQLFKYGLGDSTIETLFLFITDISGNEIIKKSFSVGQNLIVSDSIEVPSNISYGHYLINGYINSNYLYNKILEKHFFINEASDNFYFISKKDYSYDKYYLDFFLIKSDFEGEYIDVLGIMAKAKNNTPQKVYCYVLNKRYDTISTLKTSCNGIGVISKVSGRLDSMIVRVLWPDSTEIDYSVYTFKENSILLNADLNKNVLNYKLWCTESYSANSGWLMIVAVQDEKILFSRLTNTNGNIFYFTDRVTLNSEPSGIIKILVYKKGGEKISELNIFNKD